MTKRTVLIVQDQVLRCDSTEIRGQMGLHRTKRTYGISQTKRKDSIRQDQHDRKIRQNKSTDLSMQDQEDGWDFTVQDQDDR
jgi:hypothetical protein